MSYFMELNRTKIFIIRFLWCIIKRFPIRLSLCDINNIRHLPKSTCFQHPYGITIGYGTIIGENCVFAANVCIGMKRPFFGAKKESPAIIGNNIFFGNGSIILGPVKIGDNVIIGAGTLVTNDIPSDTIYKKRS